MRRLPRTFDALRSTATLLVVAIALVSLAACEIVVTSPGPRVFSVTIDQGSTVSVPEGESRQLSATVAVETGASREVSWNSSATHVATVAKTGSTTATLTAVGEGTTFVTATSTVDSTKSDTIEITVTATGSAGFDIVIRFYDEIFTSAEKDAFATAEARWEEVIVGDVVDVDVDKAANFCGQDEPSVNETVDDVLILATTFTGTAGGEAAFAGPCISRGTTSADTATSVVGFMSFDTADLDTLTPGEILDVITHEMGHVLGFGTTWESPGLDIDYLDYTTDPSGQDCRTATTFVAPPVYTGPNGVAAWQDELLGTGDVPVEESGGQGTRCGHWDEATFGNELMTGILNSGTENPLSILTVRSFVDINYTVDESAADPYSVPVGPTLQGDGFDIRGAERLLRPRGFVDTTTDEPATFE